MANEPHVPGWQPSLRLAEAARRCGARRKSDGQACRQPGMANGRCRLHGGLSTGPRTPEGLERSRRARWQHGLYSAEARAIRQEARALLRALHQMLNGLHAS